jgi:hypothetical protein
MGNAYEVCLPSSPLTYAFYLYINNNLRIIFIFSILTARIKVVVLFVKYHSTALRLYFVIFDTQNKDERKTRACI